MVPLAIVLAGLFLLVFAPFLERMGNGRRETVTMAGLALLVFGLIASLWTERMLTLASLVSIVVLAWGTAVYVFVRVRRAWARPAGVPRATEHCVSTLTEGRFTQVPGAPSYVATSNSTFSALMYELFTPNNSG